MAEKMRDGIIKRGSVYYYVVRERGRFPAKDRQGNPKLDAEGNQIYTDIRQRWVKGSESLKATKALRDEARNATHKGTYVAPQDLSVTQWLARWIDAHEVVVKPSTAAYYRGKIPYLERSIGHLRIQELSPSGLSVLWRDLLDHGGKGGKALDHATVAGIRRTLSKAMNDAVVERLIQVNPVIGSKMPRPPAVGIDDETDEGGRTAWSEQQLKAFLDNLGTDRWAPMWQLFAASGMRRGEVAGLTWSNVDLDAAEIRVRRNAVQIGSKVVTGSPKSRRGRRTFKLDTRTVSALKSWKAAQAKEKVALGPSYADQEGLVFTWPDGRRVMPDYITKEFDKAQSRVNARLVEAEADPLPRLVVHELRHTHITISLSNLVPPHVVAHRVGDDPATMFRVYSHLIPDADTAAADIFAKAVWEA